MEHSVPSLRLLVRHDLLCFYYYCDERNSGYIY